MNQELLKKELGKVDIYLLDQVMKGRYLDGDKILDAGCGKGRNLIFMHNHGFDIEGCDMDAVTLNSLKEKVPLVQLKTTKLSSLPYPDDFFDHVICNAVLHFAENDSQFLKMVNELKRVLKPSGSLFIRMTSIFGLEPAVLPKNGQHLLPDGSHRFLLTDVQLENLMFDFKFIEPLKTVNVNNLRCMSTLVLEKK